MWAGSEGVAEGCDVLMGESRGFGHSKSNRAGESQSDGIFECCEMACTDVERACVVARADDAADQLAAVHESDRSTAFCAGFAVFAAEPALRTPDGGPVDEQAHVGCESDAARVGDALAVEHQDFRPGRKLCYGLNQGGGLPEAEQPRDVGKADGLNDVGSFNFGFELEIPDHPGGDKPAPIGGKGDVAARHPVNGAVDGLVYDAAGEALLDLDCLAGGDVPGV